MLKQRLQQKLTQKLSPQQIQLIKLLEVPSMQLDQRIKKEIEENPALEEGTELTDIEANEQEQEVEETETTNDDEFTLDDYLNDEDIPSYRLNANNYDKNDDKKEIPFSGGTSFHEYLISQLGLLILTPRQKDLAKYIIGNIDDDGYLRRSLSSIVDDLAFNQGITAKKDELDEILMMIQSFDPAGIAAQNLQDCLLLQIERKTPTPSLELAEKILQHFFNEFVKKHYDKIISKLKCSKEDLKSAIEEIIKLNPKPGGSFSEQQSKTFFQIIPDFILENNEGELILNLSNSNVPDLHISRTYRNMLESYSENKQNKTKSQKDAITFVKQKLDSAKWFIDAIKQRQNTLEITMKAIIEYQKEFFQDGDEKKLKPMILKNIAERTNLDISTISRVANSKYIQTNFGIFPLKSFFSESMQTDSGEEVSTREIKKILHEFIEQEEKSKPLTDDKLTELLKSKGYKIARRTVAKYREQLNIPVARLRKEL